MTVSATLRAQARRLHELEQRALEGALNGHPVAEVLGEVRAELLGAARELEQDRPASGSRKS